MKRAGEIAHFVFYVAAVLFLGFIAIKIQKLFPGVEALVTHANASVDEIGLTMKAARITAQTEQKNSQAQLDSVNKITAAAQDDLVRFGLMITTFNTKSGAVLDQAKVSIGATSDAATALATATTADLAQTQQQIATVASAALQTLSDPNLPLTFKSLAQSSAQLDDSLANLNGVTADGKKAADFYLKQLTAPVSLAKRILGFFTWLSGRFLGY